MPAGEGRRAWAVLAVAAFSTGLAVWAVLLASRELARSFSLFLYLLANLVVLIDGLDLCLRLYFRRINASREGGGAVSPMSIALEPRRFTKYQKTLHVKPWAMVLSVHNAENDLEDFLEAVEPFRDRVWAIDDGSNDNTCTRLRQAGLHCLDGGQNRKKPGAIRFLLASLPAEIETVVVLDPDSWIRTDALSSLEEVIFDFQRCGMASLCPRLAIREDGLLARLQALEYCFTFSLGRKSLGDHSVNSGISIYRRNALAAALEEHSLSVYAEDLEISLLLLGAGERIYYDSRLVVQTEGKRTGRSWLSQRVGWAYGLIKVYFERFSRIRKLCERGFNAQYQFLVYLGLFALLFQPLKLISFALLIGSFAEGIDGLLGLGWLPYWSAVDPIYFLAAFTKYGLLMLVGFLLAVPRGERAHLLPVVPLYFFYALALVIPTTLGYANWCALRIWGRRLIPDHYQDEESFIRQHREKTLVNSVRRALWSKSASE